MSNSVQVFCGRPRTVHAGAPRRLDKPLLNFGEVARQIEHSRLGSQCGNREELGLRFPEVGLQVIFGSWDHFDLLDRHVIHGVRCIAFALVALTRMLREGRDRRSLPCDYSFSSAFWSRLTRLDL